jgi:hypothetical protein
MLGDTPSIPSFKRILRGYDPVEVHAWAAQAAATTAHLRAALEEARAERDSHQSSQHELVRTMTSAHLMAERIVEETEEEAARRRNAAVAEADRMLAVARHEASEMVAIARADARRELAALEVERTTVAAELAQLRGLLHDERLRARAGLAAALEALDASLAAHAGGRGGVDVQVVEPRPVLAVVAS